MNELLSAVRHIIADADPELPVSDVQTLSMIVAEDTASRLTQVRVLGGFAVIAIFLAGIGIHGLLSFGVSQRSQEIGVRTAIGAQASDILGMILRETAALAGAGLVLGMVLAYAAGHGLSALLAGVSPNDALTYMAGVSLAIGMAAAGSFFPALRALRVDPITAIRVE
ncbi:MAG: FtsX-like permease family protein [Acidobacteriota bacterium]|nr:FtsX-like permease family protein [Acidobacteriota bacterium]